LFSAVHDFAAILRDRKAEQIATMRGENQLELSQIRSYRIGWLAPWMGGKLEDTKRGNCKRK